MERNLKIIRLVGIILEVQRAEETHDEIDFKDRLS